jgi:hypothetical protein
VNFSIWIWAKENFFRGKPISLDGLRKLAGKGLTLSFMDFVSNSGKHRGEE